MDVGARLRLPRGPHTNRRLRGKARGRNGGIRPDLAADISRGEDKDEPERTGPHFCVATDIHHAELGIPARGM
jgi:hypothetical protein